MFVTHDQEEAMEVSYRVIVMNHGRIEQIGSPAEVYDKPASEFVVHLSVKLICSAAASTASGRISKTPFTWQYPNTSRPRTQTPSHTCGLTSWNCISNRMEPAIT